MGISSGFWGLWFRFQGVGLGSRAGSRALGLGSRVRVLIEYGACRI